MRRSSARASSAVTPRLACVKPAASVHPEPGSNSPLYKKLNYLIDCRVLILDFAIVPYLFNSSKNSLLLKTYPLISFFFTPFILNGSAKIDNLFLIQTILKLIFLRKNYNTIFRSLNNASSKCGRKDTKSFQFNPNFIEKNLNTYPQHIKINSIYFKKGPIKIQILSSNATTN